MSIRMTDYLTRHGDILTIITVTDDPIYLDEPFVQSTTYVYDITGTTATEVCNGSAFAENGGTDRHHVPHFLPGQNTALTDWLKNGELGARRAYPWRSEDDVSGISSPRLNGAAKPDSLERSLVPLGSIAGQKHCGSEPQGRRGPCSARAGQHLHACCRRDERHGIVGPQGVLVVNTGSARMTDKLQAAVNQLSAAVAAATTNKCGGVNCPGTVRLVQSVHQYGHQLSGPAEAAPVHH